MTVLSRRFDANQLVPRLRAEMRDIDDRGGVIGTKPQSLPA